jgi:hypothetical protein
MDASVSVKTAETVELDEQEHRRSPAPRRPQCAEEAGVSWPSAQALGRRPLRA